MREKKINLGPSNIYINTINQTTNNTLCKATQFGNEVKAKQNNFRLRTTFIHVLLFIFLYNVKFHEIKYPFNHLFIMSLESTEREQHDTVRYFYLGISS